MPSGFALACNDNGSFARARAACEPAGAPCFWRSTRAATQGAPIRLDYLAAGVLRITGVRAARRH